MGQVLNGPRSISESSNTYSNMGDCSKGSYSIFLTASQIAWEVAAWEM